MCSTVYGVFFVLYGKDFSYAELKRIADLLRKELLLVKDSPDLVVRDAEGAPYTVRYEAVNAMLLNEFLKEHRKVQKLEATVAQQQKDFTARFKQLDSKIQTVNDKVELGKPAPRTVENNQ